MTASTPIAIYHLSMQVISRGKGKSAVAAAAYRAGEIIKNEYDGITHDYSRKKGVAWSGIILPENAPEEYKNRAVLWNEVERIEKAKNSQLAREIEISIPKELHFSEYFILVQEYVKENFTNHGMCADICIHDKNDGNPHAHIMLTMRPFTVDKTWGDKQKKVYNLDKDGNKIYDPVKRQYKCSKIQITDWNEQYKVEEWRASWADICNRFFERTERPERIDHRSYKRQGISKIPTIHLGAAAHQMEQRGIPTERGDINRAIMKANEEIENINTTLLKLEIELQQIKDEPQQEEIEKITIKVEAKPKGNIAKPPKTTSSKTETANTPKPQPKTKPAQKLKPLKQVEKEIDIVETKLQRLEHASTVIALYNQKIEDIQRNLSSTGWFERRKMQKEILAEEQKRDEYKNETAKKYGSTPQLENKLANLLKEKKKIEDSTGVTAAREREGQRQRDEAIYPKTTRA